MTAEVETYVLYKGLVDLPLSKFIECAVDGNLSALVIEGEAPKEILVAFWSDLQQDYSELLGGSEARLNLNLYKQLHSLHATLVQVYVLIETLNSYYAPQLADMLNKLLRTRFTFDVKSESYNEDLEACITRSKKLELDIKLKEQALEALQKEDGEKAEKPSREYFFNVLISLSDYSKFLLTDYISTYEYCQRIKRLEQYITQLKSKHG